MKSCPTCNRTYTDASLNFCLEDGTPLTLNAPPATPGFDPNATIRYTDARETKPPQPATPPPSVPPGRPASQQPSYPASYQPETPVASAGSAFGQQQQYRPAVVPPPPRKSNAVWWVLGGALVLGVIVFGAVIMILAIASMDSNANGNSNRVIVNSRNNNRNANINANTANTNTNTNANLPASLSDDFSQAKWGTGNYAFGEIWYADDQYHMRAKAKSYLVMYAPSAEYDTANATVSVTARSVDGTPSLTGYGLIIHGEKKNGKLEDYALLIDTSETARYQIIKHKDDKQTVVVPWTSSSIIRSGSNSNQLEIRAKGVELSFYINGQYVDRATDTESFKGGRAGLYTSDIAEVAFDDLEIKR
jgi:hypothetical protein